MLQNWYGALGLLVCGRGRVQIGEPMPSGMKLSPVLVQTRDPATHRLPGSFFQEAISFSTGIWSTYNRSSGCSQAVLGTGSLKAAVSLQYL